MLREIIAACCMLSACGTLLANELCVACTKPEATYRCTFEQSIGSELADVAQPHVCKKVLERAGPHGNCKVLEGSQPCDGAPRTVTVADYQRLVAGDGHSTYEPGLLEKAQKGVNSTWDCVASLFGDC